MQMGVSVNSWFLISVRFSVLLLIPVFLPGYLFSPRSLVLFQRFSSFFKLSIPYLFPSPVFDWSRKWMSWRKLRSSFSASSWSCFPSSIRWKQLCLLHRRGWRLREMTQSRDLKEGLVERKSSVSQSLYYCYRFLIPNYKLLAMVWILNSSTHDSCPTFALNG